MNGDLIIGLLSAAFVGLGVAWTLLLLGCVRRRGRGVAGWGWLTAAGLLGAVGPPAGIGFFFALGLGPRGDAADLAGALMLLLCVSQLLALLCALWGLRGAWRQIEGWGRR